MNMDCEITLYKQIWLDFRIFKQWTTYEVYERPCWSRKQSVGNWFALDTLQS